ncbi:MAG: bifunctional phosphoribosyl-AMP cyclohydrolase/phosphoribosyl-ATP diphosphatase HisIE [Clostridiales bacterium]|nr:bifunctional phosphoribosyl-AMP cyclohydrolase/phosphoribosyl-ATP diphosphatase HisIE [Clostridiales bacterium]
MYKKIIPYINCENELAENIIREAKRYDNIGGDELFLYNYSFDDKSIDEFLDTVRTLVKQIEIPVIIGLCVRNFEDIKKAFYAGARQVVIKEVICHDRDIVKEGADRFGYDKLVLELEDYKLIYDKDFVRSVKDMGISALLLKHIKVTSSFIEAVEELELPVIIRDSLKNNDLYDLIRHNNVIGVSTNFYKDKEILKAKLSLKAKGLEVNTYESKVDFREFKLNSDGLIPVIVQDYRSNEVLMLAYMNEESYKQTIETGKMTYFSRSRNEIWVKGETSGHYQYLKALSLDCDKDTILAKVSQVGVACHTGSPSCFYTDLIHSKLKETNPYKILIQDYDTILDRKKNPKEGSYTNYLFDKGIDKILKKCGEEATEIVIAAKNPNAEELKYEIADFLYHMMVLMVECGLDWDDIVKELANRR